MDGWLGSGKPGLNVMRGFEGYFINRDFSVTSFVFNNHFSREVFKNCSLINRIVLKSALLTKKLKKLPKSFSFSKASEKVQNTGHLSDVL